MLRTVMITAILALAACSPVDGGRRADATEHARPNVQIQMGKAYLEYGSITKLPGTITNLDVKSYSYLGVECTFYDQNGAVLDVSHDGALDMGPGQKRGVTVQVNRRLPKGSRAECGLGTWND